MKNHFKSIKEVILILGLAFPTFSEIKEVILFVETAFGSIGHTQATSSFLAMMNSLGGEHSFDLTIQQGRSNATWASTFQKIPTADIIIFGNSGEPSFDQPGDQQTLINYFMQGGKAIGYHAAGDNSSYWPWWQETLHSGADFDGHGSSAFGLAIDPQLVAHAELNAMWEDHSLEEPNIESTEIYKFTSYPRGSENVTIMQTVKAPDAIVANHDFTWLRDIGDGQYIYTALGHASSDFNSGWLKDATWAWMEFLDGKYDEPEILPCCKTAGFEETDANCANHIETECKTVGVSQVNLNPEHVKLYNNQLSVNYASPYSVNILNINGESVFSESSETSGLYNLSEFEAGIYIIKIKAVKGSYSFRTIIK